MKGLILKDIYNAMTQGKALLFMIVIFGVCFANAASGTLIMMCTIYAAVMVVNNLAFDEMCSWEVYALTMPVTRSQLVLSKYIVSVAYALCGILLGIVMTVALRVFGFGQGQSSPELILAISVTGLAIAAVFIALLIPVNFKFGVQKGRFVLLGIAALIGGGGVILSGGEDSKVLAVLDKLGQFNGVTMILITLAAAAVIMIFSYIISVRIVNNKEF
ncbi:MAG: ABC-2 transporter permease [Firmicutes bacterium]|nr:ABC-2 transporter permease [Bacillota bacterium]